MGLLFQMEHDFIDIKDKIYQVSSGKSPAEFKVALDKREEPHMPREEIHGFNASNVTRRTDPWGSSVEISMLNYDVILMIGGVALRMQMQEFINLSRVMDNKVNTFYRHIHNVNSAEDVQATINSIRSRS